MSADNSAQKANPIKPTGLVALLIAMGAIAGWVTFRTIPGIWTPACKANVSLSSKNMDFLIAPLDGSFRPDRSVTVANKSTCGPKISANVEGPDATLYKIVIDTCHSALAPAPAHCKYTVEFGPKKPGKFEAYLEISVTGDPKSPYKIPLTGQASGK
ncbi:MAG TPA: hypothetical protein VMT58_01310 [Candidatus Binataceae bacterium]|nr:hypothetical protein [Candidatus Binataceae bacterium]